MTEDRNDNLGAGDRIVAGAEDAGKRLDVFLRDRLPGMSRSLVRAEIEAGRIAVNGRPPKKGFTLRDGDEIDLSSVRRESITILPDPDSPLSVLYENERYIVVEKPSGLPTMPKDGADAAALACRLAARYPELTGVGPPLEAGLVHRLDAETSGLLVAARSEADRQALRFLWKWRRVDKEYLALVHGAVSRSFTVLLAIGHHPKSARRMVLSPGGMSAESRVRPLCRGKNWSLVAVSLREGRRHQIRVHLAESGYAVAGDPLYGNGPAKDSVPRLMLHASRLGFRIDPSSEAVRFYSRPPEDFVSSVNRKLRGRVEEAMDQYFRDDSPGRRS